MSETHTRGTEHAVHPITGESPGISEILERRSAGERDDAGAPEATETRQAEPAPQDEAERVAAELASWRARATMAESAAETERQRANQAEAARQQAMRASEDTGFTAITTALASVEQQIDSLKAAMKSAGEVGDFGRVAEIATELGRIGSEQRELVRGKEQFEQTRTQRLSAPPPRQEPVASSPAERTILGRLGAPSREAFLANRTPATAEFLRQTPEFFTDEGAFARISGADNLARGRGLQVDTPEYFSFIKEHALSQSTSAPRRITNSAPISGTPPSRDAPGPSGRDTTRGGDIYVSADDRKAAEWMGIDPVEYAREKASLSSRGELPYRRR